MLLFFLYYFFDSHWIQVYPRKTLLLGKLKPTAFWKYGCMLENWVLSNYTAEIPHPNYKGLTAVYKTKTTTTNTKLLLKYLGWHETSMWRLTEDTV